MFNIRWLLAIGLTVAVLSIAKDGWGQDRISAYVAGDGKIVFTNLATYGQPAAEGIHTLRNRTTVPVSIATPGTSDPLDSLIESISATHGVNAALVRSVIEVESNFNRRAVSPKGAMGLMQLIPATGERFGVHDFFDPAQNINGGVRYLKFLLEMFEGNLDLSLAAYNSGENRVARLGRVPAIPETQEYVRRVRAAFDRRGARTTTLQPANYVPPAARTAPEPVASPPAAPTRRAISSTIDESGVLRFSNVE